MPHVLGFSLSSGPCPLAMDIAPWSASESRWSISGPASAAPTTTCWLTFPASSAVFRNSSAAAASVGSQNITTSARRSSRSHLQAPPAHPASLGQLLPVRTLRDRVPDGQTVGREMETVPTRQRVYFAERVGKCRNWFFEQVKDCPMGSVSKRLRQFFDFIPGPVRSGPGSEEPGHSLIPHASASSPRVKVRPSPESDRIRRIASASPISRRKRLFSARSASSSAREIETISSARAVTLNSSQSGGVVHLLGYSPCAACRRSVITGPPAPMAALITRASPGCLRLCPA
jgi:hypothetical protein